MHQPDRRSGGILSFLALIAAAYAVPYVLLRDWPVFAGAFLFWSLFGLAAIVLILIEIGRWRV